jgi:hypothetical protein
VQPQRQLKNEQRRTTEALEGSPQSWEAAEAAPSTRVLVHGLCRRRVKCSFLESGGTAGSSGYKLHKLIHVTLGSLVVFGGRMAQPSLVGWRCSPSHSREMWKEVRSHSLMFPNPILVCIFVPLTYSF